LAVIQDWIRAARQPWIHEEKARDGFMSALMRAVRHAIPLTSSTSAKLLVSCPDRGGILSAISELLHIHGANITDSAQYVDPVERRFFQRLCFDTNDGMNSTAVCIALGEMSKRFDMDYRLADGQHQKRVALFVSKFEHCLYDLLLRQRAGELACEISVIISNHPDLAYVAQQFGIEFLVVPKDASNKAAAEERERQILEARGIDLVILARYMQILSADFVRRWEGRLINIHHSFLPAFMGGRPYHQAHERGVKLIGATAHYATPVLDEGPIIEQDVVRCSHRDSVEDMVRRGRDLEKLVLARAVRWHIEDRVLLHGNKTVVFD
jgi:formyltetrahydrofolate deformylase